MHQLLDTITTVFARYRQQTTFILPAPGKGSDFSHGLIPTVAGKAVLSEVGLHRSDALEFRGTLKGRMSEMKGGSFMASILWFVSLLGSEFAWCLLFSSKKVSFFASTFFFFFF